MKEIQVLIEKIDTLFEKSPEQRALLHKAVYYAEAKHHGQQRLSGKPFIVHPINVATFLLEYQFDYRTIIAALLHDVIEDTETSEKEISEEFDVEIAELVKGVTKLTKIKHKDPEKYRIENLRKFVLSFSDDIRVLIIKLADRLDNLRTINYHKSQEKKAKIAKETLAIYVPLAERIAFSSVKQELEDICFQILEPKVREFVISRIYDLKQNLPDNIKTIEDNIKNLLLENNVEITKTIGRLKTPFSVWKKMVSQKTTFDNILDIIAIRVITKNVEDAYKALYHIHSNYKCIYERFKDYISNPKSNNYQSLHTLVYYMPNSIVEVQIRTEEMHQYAEQGIASHWNYKNENFKEVKEMWSERFANMLAQEDISMEDLSLYFDKEIHSSEVMVFTPKNEIIHMPSGSTALDFAYTIHSEVGHKCKEIEVNGKKVSLDYILKNTDKVNIVTSPYSVVNPDWINYVNTGLAKFYIRKYSNKKYNEEIQNKGISIIHYYLNQSGVKFYPEIIESMKRHLNIKNDHIFYTRILEGKINVETVLNFIFMFSNNSSSTKQETFSVNTSENSKVYISQCCKPVKGEPIIGLKLPGNIIEAHRSDCYYIKNDPGLDIIKADWNSQYSHKFKAFIEIKTEDCVNQFEQLIQIFNELDIRIISMEDLHGRFSDKNHTKIAIEVYDINHLNENILRLQSYIFILECKRY